MTDTIEASRLRELEGIIERGLQTFAAVGVALLEIRDQKLYRGTHTTFETYLRDRWDISRSYAHRTIEAAQIVALLPIGNRPQTEAVARELAPLKDDPAKMAEAWGQVTEEADVPTAAMVRAVVAPGTERPPPSYQSIKVDILEQLRQWCERAQAEDRDILIAIRQATDAALVRLAASEDVGAES